MRVKRQETYIGESASDALIRADNRRDSQEGIVHAQRRGRVTLRGGSRRYDLDPRLATSRTAILTAPCAVYGVVSARRHHREHLELRKRATGITNHLDFRCCGLTP